MLTLQLKVGGVDMNCGQPVVPRV